MAAQLTTGIQPVANHLLFLSCILFKVQRFYLKTFPLYFNGHCVNDIIFQGTCDDFAEVQQLCIINNPAGSNILCLGTSGVELKKMGLQWRLQNGGVKLFCLYSFFKRHVWPFSYLSYTVLHHSVYISICAEGFFSSAAAST